MGIRNLLREKQALAGDRLGRIVIRHGESPRDAQAREGRERHGDLIAFQFRTCQLSSLGESLLLILYCRRSNESGEVMRSPTEGAY